MRETKNKLPMLVIGFCTVMIAGLLVVVFLMWQKLNTPQETVREVSSGGNLVVDEGNLEEIENQLRDAVEDGMFQLNMNTTWRFKEGNATSTNAYISNADVNHYPITFAVYLNGEEEIYSSSLIPVGTQLKKLTLNKVLPKGQYDALCLYHLWNEEEEEKGSFGVNVVLVVE